MGEGLGPVISSSVVIPIWKTDKSIVTRVMEPFYTNPSGQVELLDPHSGQIKYLYLIYPQSWLYAWDQSAL